MPSLNNKINPLIQGLITYVLPLRSCNTMSTDVEEGMEYFNTVVVQPHRKLVTNQVPDVIMVVTK